MTVKTLSARFTKIARKTYLIGAFFIASSLVGFAASAQAQQSSTADKPSGAQPGAVDTIKTAPTYKPLDSLMQKTKTTGVHPWSNDPEYISRREEIEFEYTNLVETAQSERLHKEELEKIELDEKEVDLNNERERALLNCGGDALSSFDLEDASDCAQDIRRIDKRLKVAKLDYKRDMKVIKQNEKKALMNATFKRDQGLRDLDKEFSKKPEYKGQSELMNFQGKSAENRPRTFTKA